MRALKNEDMYILSEIADKMDLQFPKPPKVVKNENETDEQAKERIDKEQKEYGALLIMMLIKKMHHAKNEINQLIANTSEKTLDEVGKMSINETVSCLTKLIKQDGVLDFFK
jgi:hypothetical protein